MRRALPCVLLAAACGTKDGGSTDVPAIVDPTSTLANEAFFDLPYPSDARLTAAGTPDLATFPSAGKVIFENLKGGASVRNGFPVLATASFRFSGTLAKRDVEEVVPAKATSPILLVDVDETSPERGRLFPVVAATPDPDAYVPEGLLTVGARPGIVLSPKRRYAFVVTRAFLPDGVHHAAPPPAIASLARDAAPSGSRGARLLEVYRPLFATLDKIGVARTEVATATVFTTGDAVLENREIALKIAAANKVTIDALALEKDADGRYPRFCHVTGKIAFPQFQRGAPPFSSEGLFEYGPDGLPRRQRTETAQVSLAFPKEKMPDGGYPLVIYFHGSGGVARELVDGGDKGTPQDTLQWPAHVLAGRGLAMAGSSLPASPERWPGAGPFDYLNVNNPVAMRDTFRQGLAEQRMFFDALEALRVPPDVLAGCAGPTLGAGEAAFRFSFARLSVQGQSMGGMYTNLVGATDERVKAAVPTGAGGHWLYFLLRTTKVNAGGLLGIILGTPQKLDFLHPILQIAGAALEPVDPLASTPRLARRPLPGHPVRPIYEPLGKDDSFFPVSIFDAMVLGYGHPRAGDDVWPSLATAQALLSLEAKASYPIRSNLKSETGAEYTGIAVAYAPPPSEPDGHRIYRSLEAVRYQYACFHSTFRETGTAVIPAPGPEGSACPK